MSRPDRMDHELGALYRLRVKLEDAFGAAAGPNNPRDWEQPGLRRALHIVEAEIKLREPT